MAVGVGNDVDKNELTTIAMNDKDHVFMVTKYKDLVKILDALLKESCHPGTIPLFSLTVACLKLQFTNILKCYYQVLALRRMTAIFH